MKALSIIFVLVSITSLAAVIIKTPLLAGSINVGWSETDNALKLLLSEIDSTSDPEILRLAARTSAELESRGTEVMSRYVVYFYITLLGFAIVCAICAKFAWAASNKRLQIDAATPRD